MRRQRAIAAKLGIYLFAGIVLILHRIRRDLSPARRYISEYAVGPHGWLMTAAFACISSSSIALATALRKELPGLRSTPGLIALVAHGLAMGMVALFPTDLSVPGTISTPIGRAHNAASRWAARSIVLAMLLVSGRFRHYREWRDLRVQGSALTILATIARFSTGRWPASRPGMSQRVFFACTLLWLGMVARRLAILTGSDHC